MSVTSTIVQTAENTLDKLESLYSGHVFYRSLAQEHRPPVAIKGLGTDVYTSDDRVIMDACGGAAVACLGNGDPRVIKAIKDQLDKFSFVYSVPFSHSPVEQLAKQLISTSKGAFAKVGFVSGGSEAMEGVIKLARQYFVEIKQPQRTNFIARKMSYHGVTGFALGLCHHPARRAIYEPILKHGCFHHVSPAFKLRWSTPEESEEAYVQRLKEELDAEFQRLGPETVIGFAAETVVGATTGAVTPPKGYFKAMKEVCDKYGALFMLDEVMSGMGRCGTLHAWETFDGVQPDIQAVAKGLGGGFQPIGAILLNEKVASAVSKGSGFWMHGHTYQAHPLACAAALAVQKVIEEDNLLENVRLQGKRLETRLRSKVADNALLSKHIAEIRGAGLLWAIEFVEDLSTLEPFSTSLKPRLNERITKLCFDKYSISIMGFAGTVDGSKGDHCILAPAYNATPADIDRIVDSFVAAAEEGLKSVLS